MQRNSVFVRDLRSMSMLVQRFLDILTKDGGDFQTKVRYSYQEKEGQELAASYQSSMLAVVVLLASLKDACSLCGYVQARANNNWGEYATYPPRRIFSFGDTKSANRGQ